MSERENYFSDLRCSNITPLSLKYTNFNPHAGSAIVVESVVEELLPIWLFGFYYLSAIVQKE
jgi:hypothetical protein